MIFFSCFSTGEDEARLALGGDLEVGDGGVDGEGDLFLTKLKIVKTKRKNEGLNALFE